jgi:hypothetical protein
MLHVPHSMFVTLPLHAGHEVWGEGGEGRFQLRRRGLTEAEMLAMATEASHHDGTRKRQGDDTRWFDGRRLYLNRLRSPEPPPAASREPEVIVIEDEDDTNGPAPESSVIDLGDDDHDDDDDDGRTGMGKGAFGKAGPGDEVSLVELIPWKGLQAALLTSYGLDPTFVSRIFPPRFPVTAIGED